MSFFSSGLYGNHHVVGMFRFFLCLTFSGFPLLFLVLLFHGVALHLNHISISDAIRDFHSVPAVGAGNDSVRIFPAVCSCSFFHDLGPWTKSCFLFFIDCFPFHLFAFAVLFSSFSIALLYIPIASPYRMPFGTLRSVLAGTAGKSLWWIPFRDSCMFFLSQICSMRG